MTNEIMIDQLQEQIEDLKEQIERLWNAIEEMREDVAVLTDMVDDCESNLSN